MFEWLQSYPGAYITDKTRALEKAESYLSDSSWKRERLNLLKETFEWVQSYAGPYISDKARALAKSEAYIFSKQITRPQLNELKRVFERESRGSGGKEAALKRAEREVLGSEV